MESVLMGNEWNEVLAIIKQRFPLLAIKPEQRDAWYEDVRHIHAGRLKKLAYVFCERYAEKNIGRLNIAGVLRSLNRSIPYTEVDGRVSEMETTAPELDGPGGCPLCGGRKMIMVQVRYSDMPQDWPYRIRLHCICDRPLRSPMALCCRIKLGDAVPDYQQHRVVRGRVWTGEPQHSPEVVFKVQWIGKKLRVPFTVEERKERSDDSGVTAS